MKRKQEKRKMWKERKKKVRDKKKGSGDEGDEGVRMVAKEKNGRCEKVGKGAEEKAGA